MSVALFDTETPLHALRAEIQARVAAVIEQGRFILGPEVAAFESELAAYLGVRHVIGVANGTDAITIALRALGVRAGQEVVVPSFTFYATAEAVASAGAIPVFCDVDPETRNVTADTVRAVLTDETAAIVAVDLFGSPAPCAELRELGPPVLEDAAQAAGARLDGAQAGALGDVATFSFFPRRGLRGRRPGCARRAAARRGRRRPGVAPVRGHPPAGRRARSPGSPSTACRRAATTASPLHRQPAMAPYAPVATRASGDRRPGRSTTSPYR